MVTEPLRGWRAVKVTERRTAVDFAEVVRWLVEEVHGEVEKVVLVLDNLNTHKIASLYEAFPPERARRIAEKREIHHTPKHGSWLDMAEIYGDTGRNPVFAAAFARWLGALWQDGTAAVLKRYLAG